MFNLLDMDGDGKVNIEEMRLYTGLRRKRRIENDYIEKEFTKMDVNKNEHIEPSELDESLA